MTSSTCKYSSYRLSSSVFLFSEEQEKAITEKQERAGIRRQELQQLKVKKAQRPKAAKFRRTVHVAFSDGLSDE
jgi:hypothetical protein